MNTSPRHRLGDLQLKILKILWKLGQASVAEVQEVLGGQWAYTTVATMLRKMEDRGLVQHVEQQRKFLYLAAVQAHEIHREASEQFIDRLFEGSLSATFQHLLASREVSEEELAELEQILQQRRQQQQQQ